MTRKIMSIIMAAILIWGGPVTPSPAGVISTQSLLSGEERSARIDDIQAQLARQDVQKAMVALGVDPDQARMRVASLSDRELAQLDGRLETLPAGGLLGLIGAVFVVLLILEVTGVINVFKGS